MSRAHHGTRQPRGNRRAGLEVVCLCPPLCRAAALASPLSAIAFVGAVSPPRRTRRGWSASLTRLVSQIRPATTRRDDERPTDERRHPRRRTTHTPRDGSTPRRCYWHDQLSRRRDDRRTRVRRRRAGGRTARATEVRMEAAAAAARRPPPVTHLTHPTRPDRHETAGGGSANQFPCARVPDALLVCARHCRCSLAVLRGPSRAWWSIVWRASSATEERR